MLTHHAMLERLPVWGALDVSAKQDRSNSISSRVIRCRYDGQRTVAVSADDKAETQIGAVLDVLDLHLNGSNTCAGQPVSANCVTVILADGPRFIEVADAVANLLAAQARGPEVRVLVSKDSQPPHDMILAPVDFGPDTHYSGWLRLLMSVAAGPPELLTMIQTLVGSESLRAYPMLTGNPWWSLRLEGLEVGRVRIGNGWLGVGRPGKSGGSSEARNRWVQAAASEDPVQIDGSAGSIAHAVKVLSGFAKSWLPELEPDHGLPLLQNEHALESRILRGAAPITTSAGKRLDLLQPDPIVNWGSQFPTRWGRVASNSARYLDGLLRDGNTPWALEMKVEGGGGVGGYYRHAVGQAVLYRHFIRTATSLKPWFDRHQLDQTTCQAAVVVPELSAQPVWSDRLGQICAAFDVDLIQVPHRFAGLH